MEIKINIPRGARQILRELEAKGFEAYAVGGCVRDSLLGKEPEDWDICTSAKPDEVLACFKNYRVIPTGLKHGTVTVMIEDIPFEITTYRIDGEYSDNRRPDNVSFTADLTEDLTRRDFTVNAMAYSPTLGLADPFYGAKDLNNKLIRCVGDPVMRFHEDGLRILRAVRFAAVLGFKIHALTEDAINSNLHLLENISKERIAAELNKILLGDVPDFDPALFLSCVCAVIPGFKPCVGFQQNNPYHIYDVAQHTLYALSHAPKDLQIRLAVLLHDIGKPHCYTEDERGGHFYGHQSVGADMARKILTDLKYDNNTVDTVVKLIAYHVSTIVPTKAAVKRWLNKLGEELFRKLLQVMRADSLAHSELSREYLDKLTAAEDVIDEILAEEACFSLKDLAVNGDDIMTLGVKQGKEVGVILGQLLEAVMDGLVENTKEALIDEVRSRFIR